MLEHGYNFDSVVSAPIVSMLAQATLYLRKKQLKAHVFIYHNVNLCFLFIMLL